jgi:hypothetical protein
MARTSLVREGRVIRTTGRRQEKIPRKNALSGPRAEPKKNSADAALSRNINASGSRFPPELPADAVARKGSSSPL